MIQYLLSIGTDKINHSGVSLLSHLIGTKNILEDWNSPEHLCNAGLFHSVYGTEYFRVKKTTGKDIETVRCLIGEKSEYLVWAFCSMLRKDFEKLASEGTPSFVRSFAGNIKITLEPEDVSDLCNITVANLLEQLPRLPKESQALANRLVGLKAHIMPKAYDSLTQYIERGNL